MEMAERLAEFVAQDADLELLARPETGVVNWRPRVVERMDESYGRLPEGSTSRRTVRVVTPSRSARSGPDQSGRLCSSESSRSSRGSWGG